MPNSPPLSHPECVITREDVGDVVQETMRTQFEQMLSKINEVIIDTLNTKLKPLKDEMKDMISSMEHMNLQFEEVLKQYRIAQEDITFLKKENDFFRSTITDLTSRVNQLEQHSRNKNIELQCVPENKNENLIEMILKLGQAIGYTVNDTQILHCTRVSKMRRDVERPRSIIIELSTPRCRDEFLASALTFNKKNPKQKLNTSLLGLSGSINGTPIYISEHLSPSNKALHAATRVKAKQLKYKFVWIRNSRIYVRKNEESQFIWIKNTNDLDKIV